MIPLQVLEICNVPAAFRYRFGKINFADKEGGASTDPVVYDIIVPGY
jgi:hypothetical protein